MSRTMDPNLFHPYRRPGRTTQYPAVVRQACADCPVRQQCLDDALRTEAQAVPPRPMGYRGGHTPQERIAMMADARGTTERTVMRARSEAS